MHRFQVVERAAIYNYTVVHHYCVDLPYIAFIGTTTVVQVGMILIELRGVVVSVEDMRPVVRVFTAHQAVRCGALLAAVCIPYDMVTS